MATRSLNQRLTAAPQVSRGREVLGILILAVGIFFALSLLSLLFGKGTLMGPVGAKVSLALYACFGLGGCLVAWVLVTLSFRLFAGRPVGFVRLESLGFLGMVVFGAVLMHTVFGSHRLHGYSPGGAVGEYLGETLRVLVSTAGTVLVALSGIALSFVLCTEARVSALLLRARAVGMQAGGLILRGAIGGVASLKRVWPFGKKAVRGGGRAKEGDDDSERAEVGEEESREEEDASDEALAEIQADLRREDKLKQVKARVRSGLAAVAGARRGRLQRAEAAAGEGTKGESEAPQAGDTGEDEAATPFEDTRGIVVCEADASDTERVASSVIELEAEIPPRVCVVPPPIEPKEPPRPEPVIVESQFRTKRAEELAGDRETSPEFIRLGSGEFVLPGPDLLDYEEPTNSEIDKAAMKELAVRLEKALEDYGVRGYVSEIHPGPVVTMYEFVPEAGTRVAKIANLSDDLAMRLEALSVRIVAPIPGKAAVGIEVPNKNRETVYLKEIATDDVFTKAKSKLVIALGKDIEGRPVAEDLAKMPHLLVAGTTGSGKSVAMHGMITSILMHATPDEVRMILVDPKRLEFAAYEGIPHLLLPVVTDPQKANLALKWAVDEMDRRYELLSQAGVRDIVAYNKKVERMSETQHQEAEAQKRKRIQVVVTSPDGEEETIEACEGDGEEDCAQAKETQAPRKLPYIVIVIDEFADLMMCASKDVETSVARLAQKARAAGIHLILATQRPSVDVITGLIKANFPSRIALKVAQKVDSRTILDQQGAESLLGQGDMLFSKGGAAPVRVHGAYVSAEEVERIVNFLKEQGQPVYDLDILRPRNEEGADGHDEDEALDELYDQAVAIVAETRKASISLIQRRLRVGYNRAARMVERMEREGIVGPQDHLKEREVLIQPLAS